MDLISLNRAQLIHKSNTQNATRGPTLLVSAIHIAAAGFGKVKKKCFKMCSSRAMCFAQSSGAKGTIPHH